MQFSSTGKGVQEACKFMRPKIFGINNQDYKNCVHYSSGKWLLMIR